MNTKYRIRFLIALFLVTYVQSTLPSNWLIQHLQNLKRYAPDQQRIELLLKKIAWGCTVSLVATCLICLGLKYRDNKKREKKYEEQKQRSKLFAEEIQKKPVDIEKLTELIEQGILVNFRYKDFNRSTPLHLAFEYCPKLVPLLRNQGASEYIRNDLGKLPNYTYIARVLYQNQIIPKNIEEKQFKNEANSRQPKDDLNNREIKIVLSRDSKKRNSLDFSNDKITSNRKRRNSF